MIKCVPHVQHDYFSSLNQSDHCFLVLSLPLPSSLRKLPTVTKATAMTTPEINDLIGSIRKNNCSARAARFFFAIS